MSHSFPEPRLLYWLYLTFLVLKPGRLRFLLILMLQLFGAWKPSELTFPPGLSRPPREDALHLSERYKPCVRALLAFHIPQVILAPLSLSVSLSLSLPLFSTVSFSRDRPTVGRLPFAVRPHSIQHEFSPDPVAQVSSDSTLGCHRLSSFLDSQGTSQSKGSLWRYLGDTPPSFRLSLSLCQVEGLGDDLFSRPDNC